MTPGRPTVTPSLEARMREGRTQRRAQAALMLVGLIVVAGLASFAWWWFGPGPVDALAGSDTGVIAQPSERIAVGTALLTTPRGQGADLDEVTPIGATPGLRVDVLARDSSIRPSVGIQRADTLPFDPPLPPAAGASVPADGDAHLELVAVVSADRPGRYRLDGFDVRYRQGLRERRVETTGTIELTVR